MRTLKLRWYESFESGRRCQINNERQHGLWSIPVPPGPTATNRVARGKPAYGSLGLASRTFAAVIIRTARGLAPPATIPKNRFWRRWDSRRIAHRPIGAELQSGAYRLEPHPLSVEGSGPQAGLTLGPQPRPRCADVTCSVETREPKGRRDAIASAGGSPGCFSASVDKTSNGGLLGDSASD